MNSPCGSLGLKLAWTMGINTVNRPGMAGGSRAWKRDYGYAYTEIAGASFD